MEKERRLHLERTEDGMVKSRPARFLLVVLGTTSLALGTIGIVIPLLPTTPFLLLAAWCYNKSSKRFHNGLMNNRLFGNYIQGYMEGEGISVGAKACTIVLLWAAILLTIVFFVSSLLARVLLLAVALGVTTHIISIKTRNDYSIGINQNT